MSTEYDIISCRAGPVHCISSEENDDQFLLSGGLDGLVAPHDRNGAIRDKRNSNRKALKRISIACNSVPSGAEPSQLQFHQPADIRKTQDYSLYLALMATSTSGIPRLSRLLGTSS